MPTRWETFPIELKGGQVSNLPRLQQGLQKPGSARYIVNFEPSIKGGYRRINGYSKFDETAVPFFGEVRVQGSGQTGTTINVANIHEEPSAGDTFTITGVTGTYTIDTGGVSYSSTNKSATLTLTSSLASSPADKAIITFTSGSTVIQGLFYSAVDEKAFVLRGGTLWAGEGSGWTKVNVPDVGSVLVKGPGQSGNTLDIDAIDDDDYTPREGDTISIDGVELVYTITATPVVTGGTATLSIEPALDSSPADNAPVTFIQSSYSGASRARFHQFNFDGTIETVMVDGVHPPAVFTATTYKTLQGSADILGAQYVTEFKNHLFFAKDDLVTYSVPFNEESFDTGTGAGSYRLNYPCTGLIVFREQMFNFTERTIKRLTGSSSSDFALSSVAEGIGCIEGDTIQEVGGDIVFLGPDGVRFLGATERIGDFNISLSSRQIQDEVTSFINSSDQFCSTIVSRKNQYRLFKYDSSVTSDNTFGFIGMQYIDQSGQGFEWTQTKGIKAYRATSNYVDDTELVLFTNDGDYVYQMESGSDFDGTAIESFLYTPYISVNDPRIRKTAYKITTYFDPEGEFSGTLVGRYDFDDPNKIQPATIDISGGGNFTTWDEFDWGSSVWGGTSNTYITSYTTGSFFTVSLEYTFEGGEPFTLDTVLLDYMNEDRE